MLLFWYEVSCIVIGQQLVWSNGEYAILLKTTIAGQSFNLSSRIVAV